MYTHHTTPHHTDTDTYYCNHYINATQSVYLFLSNKRRLYLQLANTEPGLNIAPTIIIDVNFLKINRNIFVVEVYFFLKTSEEIKVFVWCRLVVRVWCQHYDKSKAQLILETEAGAWWWVAAGSNMSGQGQLTYQVRKTDRFMCLMCVLWRWDSLHCKLTVTLHYHCHTVNTTQHSNLSSFLNTPSRSFGSLRVSG